MKINLAFDIDDVIVWTGDRQTRQAFKNCGKKHYPQTTWNFAGYPQDVIDEYYRIDDTESLFRGGLCHKRIPYHLNNLIDSPKYKIIFVTGRYEHQLDGTVRQLLRHGINIKKEMIHIVGRNSKMEILKDFNPRLYFEDAPHHITECIKNGIKVVMITNNKTPWNHSLRGYVPNVAPGLISALRQNGIIK
ncbi:MAG: hypothetical protein FWG39_02660 [Alphaproteobacteria bacterium]|nr:hypothetical protein [Alphaproteobacteria bacterium]